MPGGTIQWSWKMFATFVALFFVVGTSRASLDYPLVITIKYWFSFMVLGRDPSIFIVANSSLLHDRNNWSGILRSHVLPFLSQLMRCATVAYTSFAM